jgi:iron complex outermembrane recepter protein
MRCRGLATAFGLLLAVAAHADVVPPDGPTLKTAIPPGPLGASIANFHAQTNLEFGSGPTGYEGAQSPGAAAGERPEVALRHLLRGTGYKARFQNRRSFRIEIDAQPRPPPRAAPDPADSPGGDSLQPEIVVTSARRRVEPIDDVPIDAEVVTAQDLASAGIKGTWDLGPRVPGLEFDFYTYVGAGVYTNLAIRGVTDRYATVTQLFLEDIPIPQVRSNTFGRALPASFDLAHIEVLRGPQGTIMGANTQGGAIRYVPNAPSLESGVAGAAEGEWATTEWGSPTYEGGSWLDVTLRDGQLGFRLSGWYHSDGGYVDRVNPFKCSIQGGVAVAGSCPVTDRDSDRVTSRSFRGILSFRSPDGTWRFSPALSYQQNATRDTSTFFTYLSPDQGSGSFNNGSLFAQPASDAFYLATIKVAKDFGDTTLNASTAYFDRVGSLTVDDTESIGWSGPGNPGGWGNPLGAEYPSRYGNAVTSTVNLNQRFLSQEIRLGSKDLLTTESNPEAPPPLQLDALTWFIALWYSHARYQETGAVVGPDMTANDLYVRSEMNGQLSYFQYLGPLAATDTTTTYQDQLALFGEGTQAIGSHFALNAGLRVERDDNDAHDAGSYDITHGRYLEQPAFHLHDVRTVAVPRFSLQYDVHSDEGTATDHYLAYLSAAKGFSPAGVDAALATCFRFPMPYPLETIWSYELAVKGAWLDGRLHLGGTVFHTHWDNGPAPAGDPGNWGNCLFRHMPGTAASSGFDLETQVLPGGGIKVQLATAYSDSRYTQTVRDSAGQVVVRAGDAVGTPPFVTSPWALRATLEKTLSWHPFDADVVLGAEDVFHSRNPGPFYTQVAGSPLYAPRLAADPSTNVLNLRVEITSGHSRLKGRLYMNNVLASQPTLLMRNKGDDPQTLLNSTLYYAATLRPRTVGASFEYCFGDRCGL